MGRKGAARRIGGQSLKLWPALLIQSDACPLWEVKGQAGKLQQLGSAAGQLAPRAQTHHDKCTCVRTECCAAAVKEAKQGAT